MYYIKEVHTDCKATFVDFDIIVAICDVFMMWRLYLTMHSFEINLKI